MKAALAMLAAAVWVSGASADPVKAPPEAAQKILGKLKAPAGFDMTVFASPPDQ